METTADKWNEKLKTIREQGTIAEYQDVLVDALKDIGIVNHTLLQVSTVDSTWACKLIELEKKIPKTTPKYYKSLEQAKTITCQLGKSARNMVDLVNIKMEDGRWAVKPEMVTIYLMGVVGTCHSICEYLKEASDDTSEAG